MTATATTAPPIKASRKPRAATRTTQIEQVDSETELRRWTPEEVVAKKLLPYRTARSLKEKCYRREVIHHNDGGRITFTADDIRRENARNVVEPLAA